MAHFCELFDGTQDDLEKMIFLEKLMLPKLMEKGKGEEQFDARRKN